MKIISENEARKDFSKAERIDYARRLERIESLKAEKRMKSGKAKELTKKSSEGETLQIVAQKMGIGSKDTYRKEKYIVENKDFLSPEDFANCDEGKLYWSYNCNVVKKTCDRTYRI